VRQFPAMQQRRLELWKQKQNEVVTWRSTTNIPRVLQQITY
jgi:hypothetical protein